MRTENLELRTEIFMQMISFRKALVLLGLVLCWSYSTKAHQGKDSLTLRVMSYNVENLFDYEHDNLKDDQEFLPDAQRKWNRRKYKRKLNAIASDIMYMGCMSKECLSKELC